MPDVTLLFLGLNLPPAGFGCWVLVRVSRVSACCARPSSAEPVDLILPGAMP